MIAPPTTTEIDALVGTRVYLDMRALARLAGVAHHEIIHQPNNERDQKPMNTKTDHALLDEHYSAERAWQGNARQAEEAVSAARSLREPAPDREWRIAEQARIAANAAMMLDEARRTLKNLEAIERRIEEQTGQPAPDRVARQLAAVAAKHQIRMDEVLTAWLSGEAVEEFFARLSDDGVEVPEPCRTCWGVKRLGCPTCRGSGEATPSCLCCSGNGAHFEVYDQSEDNWTCEPCAGTGRVATAVVPEDDSF